MPYADSASRGVRSAISGHRFYSPSLGRFINKDPIEEQGGLNLYGFCGNNGINHWDLLGMVVPDPFGDLMADGAYREQFGWEPNMRRFGAYFPVVNISYRAPDDLSFGINSEIFTANISITPGRTEMHEFSNPSGYTDTIWAPAQTIVAGVTLGLGNERAQGNLLTLSSTYYEAAVVTYVDVGGGAYMGRTLPLFDFSFPSMQSSPSLEVKLFEGATYSSEADKLHSVGLVLGGVGVGQIDLTISGPPALMPTPGRSGPAESLSNINVSLDSGSFAGQQLAFSGSLRLPRFSGHRHPRRE